MTVKQVQRGGRLQEEGCLEYGKDDSWSTTGSICQRPLASQEVSQNNERSCLSMRHALVQLERICRRENVGRKNHKTESTKSFPSYLFYNNKNNCFLDYILDAREKELQVQQGSGKY